LGATAAQGRYSPAGALERVRDFLRNQWPGTERGERMIVEIEVDSLEQLKEVLPERPDIVLLDNMSPETLRRAVAIRDELAKGVELEASGSVNLDTVRGTALSGVERISVGALTHSAICFDVGLDWKC